MTEAELMFREWQMRYSDGKSRSFKHKQVRYLNTCPFICLRDRHIMACELQTVTPQSTLIFAWIYFCIENNPARLVAEFNLLANLFAVPILAIFKTKLQNC